MTMQLHARRAGCLTLCVVAGISCSSQGDSAAPDQASALVTSVTVVPAVPSTFTSLFDSLTLEAVARNASGATTQDVSITWASADTAIVRVSQTGVVTALARGVTRVTATTRSNVTGSVEITVAPLVKSVDLGGLTGVSMSVGQGITVGSVTRDARGHALSDRVVSWTTTAPNVVSIERTDSVSSATGMSTASLTALAPGFALVFATSDGVASRDTIRVSVLPDLSSTDVARFTVAPNPATIQEGSTIELSVSAFTQEDKPTGNYHLGWMSTNPAIATVTPTNWDRARLVGVAQGGPITVIATIGSKTVTVPVTVTAAAPPPSGLVFSAVSAGANHTCALTEIGEAFCWGYNGSGALGDGTKIGRTVPTPVAGGYRFATISAGDGTCGVTTTGQALCWGTASAVSAPTEGCGWVACVPAPLRGSDALVFSSIDVGQLHACGTTTSGDGYCWGYAEYAALGADTAAHACAKSECDEATPVAGGLTFARIKAGSYSATCGLTRAGAAYCWGFDWGGALGTRALPWLPAVQPGPGLCADIDTGWYVPCSFTPLAVDGGITFVDVDTGIDNACGVSATGAAYCWGENYLGVLGAPDVPWDVGPLRVTGGLSFATISVGVGGFVCGVTTNHRAYCWGDNETGALGSGGSYEYSTVPVLVAGELAFNLVSAGGQWGPFYSKGGHTCGLTTNGAVFCWGRNDDGQLGNGSTSSSRVPVRVRGQP
jgi:Regulator of chromosome condensation (RCC1) repeat/Bacterial Ig-like domain (group 2)